MAEYTEADLAREMEEAKREEEANGGGEQGAGGGGGRRGPPRRKTGSNALGAFTPAAEGGDGD